MLLLLALLLLQRFCCLCYCCCHFWRCYFCCCFVPTAAVAAAAAAAAAAAVWESGSLKLMTAAKPAPIDEEVATVCVRIISGDKAALCHPTCSSLVCSTSRHVISASCEWSKLNKLVCPALFVTRFSQPTLQHDGDTSACRHGSDITRCP